MLPMQHIHPMVVHFPIVFALCLVAIDALALWKAIPLDGPGTYARFSFATALLTGLSALVALAFGEIAMAIATAHGVPETLMEMHEGLGTTTALAYAAWAALRWGARWRGIALDGRRTAYVVAIETALVLLVLVTAYFGGALVYGHGVNVGLGG